MKYRECQICGAHLDYGEVCDCQNEERGRPAATETTSKSKRITSTISLSKRSTDVNNRFQLKGGGSA